METKVNYKALGRTAKRKVVWDYIGVDAEFHAPECKNAPKDYFTEIEVASVRECVDAAWGETAGSYYAENGYSPEEGWKVYRGCTKVCPCVGKLQNETSAS